jgi:predicted metal-dependent HD superfamily phosphohydrolase
MNSPNAFFNANRWRTLMRQLSIEEGMEMFDALVEAYDEPQRHYHTASHINACLAELDRHRSLAEYPAEVEAALWFHDFVYKPHASDNEKRSAEAAQRYFSKAALARERIDRIDAHIMATEHKAEATNSDSALVVDIDLSILGRDESTYARFEQQVRAEYRWVPMFVYRRKRIEVLRSFLKRPHIYSHVAFRNGFETQARRNLAHAIAQLEGHQV